MGRREQWEQRWFRVIVLRGDVAQSLAAHNAGASAVDQAGGIPDISERRSCVTAILEKLGIKPASGGK